MGRSKLARKQGFVPPARFIAPKVELPTRQHGTRQGIPSMRILILDESEEAARHYELMRGFLGQMHDVLVFDSREAAIAAHLLHPFKLWLIGLLQGSGLLDWSQESGPTRRRMPDGSDFLYVRVTDEPQRIGFFERGLEQYSRRGLDFEDTARELTAKIHRLARGTESAKYWGDSPRIVR